MSNIKKITLSAFIYLTLIVITKYVFFPEKYIYGHTYENHFLEFLAVVVVIPFSVGLFFLAKTAKTDKSIAITILFIAFGFSALLLTTFIEKSIVRYQLNHDGKLTLGVVDYTYIQRAKSRKKYYNFIVSFNVNDSSYYSLPGFTKEEKYKVGDTITVRYLERNPFLNEIFY